MTQPAHQPCIRLRGVRQNNLKNFDLDLPLGQIIVVTGPSGSGKSSLAFDTLFAEGQRRYIETFSPYARQFFDRMDKPKVDRIDGIPPAIAIEQRNAVRTTRSTVGTMTEICDYMKTVWPHVAQLRCRNCQQPVRRDTPATIWETLLAHLPASLATTPPPGDPPQTPGAVDVLIAFDLPLSEKFSLADSIGLVRKQGYQRLIVDRRPMRLEAALEQLQVGHPTHLTVLQDRLALGTAGRSRFAEACEQAYHFGRGRLRTFVVAREDKEPRLDESSERRFSRELHCAACDLPYREPTPALFSFNHPLGACPACKGFGRIITIDLNLALPDRRRTLAEGVVKPWQSGMSAECQQDMMKFCRKRGVPIDVPYHELSPEWQQWVLEGDPGYGQDPEHEWPKAWYGVRGYFRWLEGKSYKMHVRVLLSRYRSYQTCPDCRGGRLQPEAMLHTLTLPPALRQLAAGQGQLSLPAFYALSVDEADRVIAALRPRRSRDAADPLSIALEEVGARLGFLREVGLGYLTLDRATRTLSGGETERVSLSACLGTRLVNTLFVLDEPSLGLHHRDTTRLVKVLKQLRDAGNTVVVVEHEAAIMRAADQIVDLGPGHGATGGRVVFQGNARQVLHAEGSLTGGYLSGRLRVSEANTRTSGPGESDPWLVISHATLHNLRDLTVRIPLRRLVCVTGVSGSGKTTLIKDVLLPALRQCLAQPKTGAAVSPEAIGEEEAGENDGEVTTATQAILSGWESLAAVILVDQSVLARSPRTNPAVYTGAFEHVRQIFTQSEEAKKRGFEASAFSFNSSAGQCELCRGAGYEKIEMQFLSDVFVRCPACNGRRYRSQVLEVRVAPEKPPAPRPPSASGGAQSRRSRAEAPRWNIADFLDATIDEALDFLARMESSRPGQKATEALRLLQEVGLGYLSLGQPLNTLSGGESQRLKLARHLSPFAASGDIDRSPALFIFDEPTTGLHFDDIRVLLKVFRRLVAAGHSVVIVEHQLDVIRAADWVIDLGPEAGEAGGKVVVAGPPGTVASCPESHTGAALRGEEASVRALAST